MSTLLGRSPALIVLAAVAATAGGLFIASNAGRPHDAARDRVDAPRQQPTASTSGRVLDLGTEWSMAADIQQQQVASAFEHVKDDAIRALLARARKQGSETPTTETIVVDIQQLLQRFPAAAERHPDVEPLEQPALAFRVSKGGAGSFEILPDGDASGYVAYENPGSDWAKRIHLSNFGVNPAERRYVVLHPSGTLKPPKIGDLHAILPESRDRLELSIAGSELSPQARILCKIAEDGSLRFYVGAGAP